MLRELEQWVNMVAQGSASTDLHKWLASARLIPLAKDDKGGVRPIAIGEVLRRLVGKCLCKAVAPLLPQKFLPLHQVGVGIPHGLDAAIASVSHKLEEGSKPSSSSCETEAMCCVKVDMRNAFNEVERKSFLERCATMFPTVYPWARWLYESHSTLFLSNGATVPSAQGVQQGDPLGPLLFACALGSVSTEIANSVWQVWYLDDGTLIGREEDVAEALDLLMKEGPAFGLHLHLGKCEVYWPGRSDFPKIPKAVQRKTEGLALLGSPLHGSEDFFERQVRECVDKAERMQRKLAEMEDAHSELYLLRQCASSCRLAHLLRTVPFDKASRAFSDFDTAVLDAVARIAGAPLTQQASRQATLPTAKAGLGMRKCSEIALSALLGSCNKSRSLVQRRAPRAAGPGRGTCCTRRAARPGLPVAQ